MVGHTLAQWVCISNGNVFPPSVAMLNKAIVTVFLFCIAPGAVLSLQVWEVSGGGH